MRMKWLLLKRKTQWCLRHKIMNKLLCFKHNTKLMPIFNLVTLLLVISMVALFSQLNLKATIIRPTPNSPHNYQKKVTIVTIVAIEWQLLGVQLVCMGLNLVMRMTVMLVLMDSKIGSGT
jgi:anthranilate/para-aminobenzoate synthase component II